MIMTNNNGLIMYCKNKSQIVYSENKLFNPEKQQSQKMLYSNYIRHVTYKKVYESIITNFSINNITSIVDSNLVTATFTFNIVGNPLYIVLNITDNKNLVTKSYTISDLNNPYIIPDLNKKTLYSIVSSTVYNNNRVYTTKNKLLFNT